MFFDPLYLHTLRNLSPFLIGLLIAAIPAAQAFICFVFNLSVKLFGVASLLCFSVISAFFAVVVHRTWIHLLEVKGVARSVINEKFKLYYFFSALYAPK